LASACLDYVALGYSCPTDHDICQIKASFADMRNNQLGYGPLAKMDMKIRWCTKGNCFGHGWMRVKVKRKEVVPYEDKIRWIRSDQIRRVSALTWTERFDFLPRELKLSLISLDIILSLIGVNITYFNIEFNLCR
jgi:hypothetical protein